MNNSGFLAFVLALCIAFLTPQATAKDLEVCGDEHLSFAKRFNTNEIIGKVKKIVQKNASTGSFEKEYEFSQNGELTRYKSPDEDDTFEWEGSKLAKEATRGWKYSNKISQYIYDSEGKLVKVERAPEHNFYILRVSINTGFADYCIQYAPGNKYAHSSWARYNHAGQLESTGTLVTNSPASFTEEGFYLHLQKLAKDKTFPDSSVSSAYYTVDYKSGEDANGPYLFKILNSSRGSKILEKTWYNKEDLPATQEAFTVGGSILRFSYKYKYDNQGNWVQRETYEETFQGIQAKEKYKWKLKEKSNRAITYW